MTTAAGTGERPRLTRDDLYLSDVARMRAARARGYVAVLWRMPLRAGQWSLLRMDLDHATISRHIDSRTLAECIVMPVADLLAEVGE